MTIGKPEFPGNSKKARLDTGPNLFLSEPPSRKIEKVVTGTVLRKKKSMLDRFANTFFGDDSKSVGSYVLWDVLIPAAKNTISEMVRSGIDMLLFGEAKGSSTRRDKDRSYVSYNTKFNDRDRHNERQEPDRRTRTTLKFDDILIETRSDAEEVLSSLVDQIDEYGVATVADFYDLVGLTTEWEDNKRGWHNLHRATVERVREGYILVMPKPEVLD